MKTFIVTASNGDLKNEVYLMRLWIAAKNMSYSRRQWPNIIFRAIYDYKGVILCPDGRIWPIPDIDQVMGDSRWFSYYFEESEGKPLRTVRLLERLRVLDLFFRIEKPNIQAHFGR